MEEIVQFKNRKNQSLNGVIHVPDQKLLKQKVGIILLNSGLKDRVGPHRLYIKIARKLCKEGFYVLRFDSSGLGDSEGMLKSGLSVQNFALIEKGLFVDDALSAIDLFLPKTEVSYLVLAGLCGGAITALLTASIDARVGNLILMDPSIVLDETKENKKIHPHELQIVISSYKNKLIDLSFWKSVFISKRDYLKILKMLIAYLNLKFKRILCNNHIDNNSMILDRPLNKKFLDAFFKYMRSKRSILFLMSETDKAAWEFKNKFEKSTLSDLSKNHYCRIKYVNTANHEFASLTAQEILLNEINTWLHDNYCT